MVAANKGSKCSDRPIKLDSPFSFDLLLKPHWRLKLVVAVVITLCKRTCIFFFVNRLIILHPLRVASTPDNLNRGPNTVLKLCNYRSLLFGKHYRPIYDIYKLFIYCYGGLTDRSMVCLLYTSRCV